MSLQNRLKIAAVVIFFFFLASLFVLNFPTSLSKINFLICITDVQEEGGMFLASYSKA